MFASLSRVFATVAALAVALPLALSRPTPSVDGAENATDSLLLGKNYTHCSELRDYRWMDKGMESQKTYTAQSRENNSFLLFGIEERTLQAKDCGSQIGGGRPRRRSRHRGKQTHAVNCRGTLRTEKPKLCLRDAAPNVCNDPSAYDVNTLRDYSDSEKFMAVWNWKLDRYTCLQFNVNYTHSGDPRDHLYHMTLNSGAKTIIHSSGTTYVYSGSTSTDVSLVYVQESGKVYDLQFRVLKFNHTSCTTVC